MSKIPIALQLYPVREDCARDLPATLESVADIGYQGVEFAGYYGRGADELRDILDNLGLKLSGTHIPIESLLEGELERTIEFNQTLGNRFLIVPSLPAERRKSKATWLETAGLINKIAERLKPEGMHVGYHNHTIEFQPIDEELPWDIFFGATVSDVIMQLDTGNAMRGGVYPEGILEILKRYPGRATTVHLKEFSSTNERALIGEGQMKWKEFFSLCETVGGTEWYIVEQESYAFPPLECVTRCLENLKKMRRQTPV